MTRNELQNNLKKLGFKGLTIGKTTLIAYAQIKLFLEQNKTPIKAITKVYLYNDMIHIVLNNLCDLEIGYTKHDDFIIYETQKTEDLHF